jgi:hypothetical protein
MQQRQNTAKLRPRSKLATWLDYGHKLSTTNSETEIVQRLGVVLGYGNYELWFFCFFIGYRMNAETKNYGIEVTWRWPNLWLPLDGDGDSWSSIRWRICQFGGARDTWSSFLSVRLNPLQSQHHTTSGYQPDAARLTLPWRLIPYLRIENTSKNKEDAIWNCGWKF